jgi:hypothetical protein
MAANTALNFTLQARDWEGLIGIINSNPDPPIQELYFALCTFARNAAVKPSGSTNVTIATTEYAVTRLAVFLYGTTLMNVANDTGANLFTRVMSAVRAANNAADNYISTTLATADAAYAAAALAIRKNGRAIIQMSQYDSQ